MAVACLSGGCSTRTEQPNVSADSQYLELVCAECGQATLMPILYGFPPRERPGYYWAGCGWQPERWVCDACGRGFVELPERVAAPAARRYVRILQSDTDVDARIEAAFLLSGLDRRGTIAFRPLLQALDDPAPSIRAAALDGLATYLSKRVELRVRAMELVIKDSSGRVRAAAAACLRQPNPDRETLATLALALADRDAEVRYEAVRGISMAENFAERAVRLVRPLLRDEHPAVRAEACRGLGKLGPKATSAVPDLRNLQSDEHSGVRQAAAEALAMLNVAVAVPASDGLP